MGEWVLVWIVVVTGVSGRSVQVPDPIYFHDREACAAMAKVLPDPDNKGVMMGGRCYPTRSSS